MSESFDREELLEQYGADNLEYIVEKYEELLAEHSELNEEEIFGASLVGAVRTAGFTLTCGEIARRTVQDEDRIRKGVEIISQESEYVERDIEFEDSSEYMLLFINNHKPSKDFARVVQELYKEIVWNEDTPVAQDLESFDSRTEAATVAFIAGHTSHRKEDSMGFEQVAELFHTDTESVRDCYYEAWDSNGYRIKPEVLDQHGVVQHIREDLSEELELSEEKESKAIRKTYELGREEYSQYNNKAVATVIVHTVTGEPINECAIQCNEATAERIGERLELI